MQGLLCGLGKHCHRIGAFNYCYYHLCKIIFDDKLLFSGVVLDGKSNGYLYFARSLNKWIGFTKVCKVEEVSFAKGGVCFYIG